MCHFHLLQLAIRNRVNANSCPRMAPTKYGPSDDDGGQEVIITGVNERQFFVKVVNECIAFAVRSINSRTKESKDFPLLSNKRSNAFWRQQRPPPKQD